MKAGASLRRYAGQLAFAGIAAGLAMAVLLLSGAGYWAFGELKNQNARYRNYQALQRDAGKADSLSLAYGRFLTDLDALRKALPAENQGSHVLNFLVEAARRMDLAVGGINALDEIPFPGYTELPFELKLSGGFPSLVRFIHTLETQGMVLQVRRLAAKSTALNKSRIQVDLEISVFVPKGALHAAATDPLPKAIP